MMMPYVMIRKVTLYAKAAITIPMELMRPPKALVNLIPKRSITGPEKAPVKKYDKFYIFKCLHLIDHTEMLKPVLHFAFSLCCVGNLAQRK